MYTNVYVTRSQFPIILAYGITIHKSQSLSLPNSIMDIGNSAFGSGMTYVALPRVTTLDGVSIINFDPSRVKASAEAIQEYNRLRSIYRPDLEQISITANTYYSIPDTIWYKKILLKQIHKTIYIMLSYIYWASKIFTITVLQIVQSNAYLPLNR